MSNADKLPKELIAHVNVGKLMQLASTCHEGPRVFSVWYALDQGMRELVFISNRNRNHSREFAINSRVGGTIVAIELEGLGQKVEGASFFGVVSEPRGEALFAAYNSYAEKWPAVRQMFGVSDIASNKTDMRVYVIFVKKWVFFSERVFPNSPRQEFSIEDEDVDRG